jgi:hypothetical protein
MTLKRRMGDEFKDSWYLVMMIDVTLESRDGKRSWTGLIPASNVLGRSLSFQSQCWVGTISPNAFVAAQREP